MYFKSKRATLVILAITALACSRAMFAFFDDPEGPNLLIVTVLAAIVFLVSWAAYSRSASLVGWKRFALAILVQIVLVTILYFLGK